MIIDSLCLSEDDQYNIPRGVDCTDQLNDWVYKGSPEQLMATGSRDLPELVRRFTQDVYMCVYIQPDYGMYDIHLTEPSQVGGASTGNCK